jgi:hypothetical protein
MTYPQAIFGGSLAIALALLIVGLAGSGVAQQSASFDLGTPTSYSNQLVVALVNTTNGDVRFCRVIGSLSPECGPWRGVEPVKE